MSLKDQEILKLENQICFPFYAISRLITQRYQPLLEELELTYPQYLVMLTLWEHKKLSVGDICQLLVLNSNTLTPLLKRMEGNGLIDRVRSEDDERKVFITLTIKGEALQEKAICIPKQLIEGFDYDENDAAQFGHKIKDLLIFLQEKSH